MPPSVSWWLGPAKVLTETLRRLQFNGLVDRQADPDAPSRVEYQLTALGRTLLAPIDAVGAWARGVMDVAGDRRAQERCDSARPTYPSLALVPVSRTAS